MLDKQTTKTPQSTQTKQQWSQTQADFKADANRKQTQILTCSSRFIQKAETRDGRKNFWILKSQKDFHLD